MNKLCKHGFTLHNFKEFDNREPRWYSAEHDKPSMSLPSAGSTTIKCDVLYTEEEKAYFERSN